MHQVQQCVLEMVRVLDLRAPAELARLFTSHGLGDDVRRAAEAVAACPVPGVVIGDMVAQIKHAGPARKVSVSMPEDLTTAVQQRVGRGKFSQYVDPGLRQCRTIEARRR